MGQLHPLTSNSALESTIDKILTNTEKNIVSNIKSALDDSQQNLDDAIPKLDSEYDKIISDAKKSQTPSLALYSPVSGLALTT